MIGAVAAAALATVSGLLAAVAVEEGERSLLLARAGNVPAPPSSPKERMRLRGAASWILRPVALVLALAAGDLIAGPVGAAAGVCAALALPVALRRRAEAQRAQRLESQLAEAVATIAAGLRAGHSLLQSLGLAAEGSEEPLRPALRDIVDRTALGVPLAEGVEGFIQALPGSDARLVAGVLGLHQRTGGDLPPVLDQLARTLRERRAAAREVRSLTAQARLSGAILGFLPIGFFLFLSATSRQDIAAAYRSPAGATAIGLGLAMQLLAFAWIRRLLRVEA